MAVLAEAEAGVGWQADWTGSVADPLSRGEDNKVLKWHRTAVARRAAKKEEDEHRLGSTSAIVGIWNRGLWESSARCRAHVAKECANFLYLFIILFWLLVVFSAGMLRIHPPSQTLARRVCRLKKEILCLQPSGLRHQLWEVTVLSTFLTTCDRGWPVVNVAQWIQTYTEFFLFTSRAD